MDQRTLWIDEVEFAIVSRVLQIEEDNSPRDPGVEDAPTNAMERGRSRRSIGDRVVLLLSNRIKLPPVAFSCDSSRGPA